MATKLLGFDSLAQSSDDESSDDIPLSKMVKPAPPATKKKSKKRKSEDMKKDSVELPTEDKKTNRPTHTFQEHRVSASKYQKVHDEIDGLREQWLETVYTKHDEVRTVLEEIGKNHALIAKYENGALQNEKDVSGVQRFSATLQARDKDYALFKDALKVMRFADGASSSKSK